MRRLYVVVATAFALLFGLAVAAPASASTYLYNTRCDTFKGNLFAGMDVYDTGSQHVGYATGRYSYTQVIRWAPDIHWQIYSFQYGTSPKKLGNTAQFTWTPNGYQHSIVVTWHGSRALTLSPYKKSCTMYAY